jgi:hypothetical protein
MLRAAILGNHRPTFLIFGEQPDSEWTDLDRLLYQAYRIYDDEFSKNSGLPYWITRNIDPAILIVVEERKDYADTALAKWDAENGDKKNKRGVSRYAVVLDADGNRMEYGGLTRQDFHRAAIQETQDRADDIDIDRDRPEGGYDPAEYGDGLTNPA